MLKFDIEAWRQISKSVVSLFKQYWANIVVSFATPPVRVMRRYRHPVLACIHSFMLYNSLNECEMMNYSQ